MFLFFYVDPFTKSAIQTLLYELPFLEFTHNEHFIQTRPRNEECQMVNEKNNADDHEKEVKRHRNIGQAKIK